MNRKRRLLIWVTSVTAILFAIAIIAAVVAPRLIDAEAVRLKITKMVAQQVGGTIDYDHLELDVLPLPSVRFHGLQVVIPDTGQLRVAELGAYPRILPLLTGNLHLVRLDLDTPAIEIKLPQRAEKDPTATEPFQADAVEEKLSAFLSDLGKNAPNMTIDVTNGQVTLLADAAPPLEVKDINGSVVTPPGQLSIDITCRSSAWERAALTAKLNAENLTGEGKILLQGFEHKKLVPLLFPEGQIPLSESVVNLDATFSRSESGRFIARWTGSLPVLAVRNKGEIIQLPISRLDGEAWASADDLQLTLSALQVEQPALSLSGRLRMGSATPRIAIEATIPEDDLVPVRKTVLKLLGNFAAVRTITDVVRAGTAKNTTVRLQGDSWADLGSLSGFYLQGGLVNGNIFVPGLELDLNNVSGEVTIADTVLACKNVDAALGKTLLNAGIMTLGLAGGDAPFHLEADIAADLKELPGVLEKTVSDKKVLAQVRAVEHIEGQARGKLIIGESTGNVNVTVQANSVLASVKHRDIPYPLKLTGGGIALRQNRFESTDLSGSIGQSAFDKLSGRMALTAPYQATLTANRLKLDLKENLEWINSGEALRGAVSDLRYMSGKVDLTDLTLKGPLTAPLKWDLLAKGKMANVAVDSKLLPHPVAVAKTDLEVTGKQGHFVVKYTNADVKMKDAAFHFSGRMERDTAGIARSEATFSGQMQSESIETLSKLLHFPQISRIRSPLEVSGARVLWEKKALTVSANLQPPGAPIATLDLHQAPGDMNIRLRLTQWGERLAEFSLAVSEQAAELTFKGDVDGATIAKLVTTEGLPPGQVKGDFKARMLLNQPSRSTATGRLEIQRIMFPWNLKVPVTIQSAVLTGNGNHLTLEDAQVVSQEQQMTLRGEIGLGDEGVRLDMNLTGDSLDLTPVVKAFSQEPVKEQASDEAGGSVERPTSDAKTAPVGELPVTGTIHVDVGRLTYDKFEWKPFRADVALTPGSVDATVTEAVLCELAMPGRLTFTAGDMAVDFTVSAEKQELRPSISCLLGPDYQTSGTFDMEGNFKGRGKAENLARSIEGQVQFSARDGRIYQDFLFKNLLNFLSITEVFVGRLPDLGKEGFAYYSINYSADIKDGKVLLSRAVMDGSTIDVAMSGEVNFFDQTLDLKGLIAPLKTVRRVVDLVPFVGKKLADKFTTIPFQATGRWENPLVETTIMSSIAPDLMDALNDFGKVTPNTIDPTAAERD